MLIDSGSVVTGKCGVSCLKQLRKRLAKTPPQAGGGHRAAHLRAGMLGIAPVLQRLLPRSGRPEGNHRKGAGTTTGAGLAKAALQIVALITVVRSA